MVPLPIQTVQYGGPGVLSYGWCLVMSTAPNPPPLTVEQRSSESRSPDAAMKLQVADLFYMSSRMIMNQGL